QRSLQVDVDHLVQVLPRELEERPVCTDAGIGYEDVDASEPIGGLMAERRQRIEIADVARRGDGAVEPEVVAASRRQAEVDPARVERARDRGADAAACAGDDGSLP